ncbi:MAG: HAMP domain-containing protein [Alphaproteobacteria bacterium]|nr:HAMP domain-containing protein [Alphaproteobacteria bacterium]
MSGHWSRRVFLSRDALIYAALGLAFIVASSVAAFLFIDDRVERILLQRQAAIVDSELKLLELVDREEGRDGLVRSIARRVSVPNDDFQIQALIDRNGKYLAGDVDWPSDLIVDGAWRPIQTYARKGVPVIGYGRAIVLPDGAKILVGRDRSAQRAVQSALAEALLTALGILLAVALALGIFLNRLVLGRIDTIATTARRIISGDLHERIPARGQDSEFDRLTGVLNSMLERNEAHFDQMRLVTDAIAHDLRGPLQHIKADLERVLLAEGKAPREAAVARAVGEIDEALSTFNALLDIARAEAGIGQETFDQVDLANLVEDVVEVFGPLAEEKRQKLTAQLMAMEVRGQSTLLRQSVGNLVHNAIKFSPQGATIVARLDDRGGNARIIVEDNGPGIPENERETALQPFGRLSRDRPTDGKGLGLALVAACAKLHGGRFVLEDAHPGLRAIIELPPD